MSSSSHSSFRFVPTLTEVVRPSDFAATEILEQQQLTERLLQRIMPKVEAQLRASLQTLVQDHLRMLEPRLQEAVELAARQAIAKAVTEELDVSTDGSESIPGRLVDSYQ